VQRLTLAITGASGAPYALRLLACLLQAGVQVHLLLSDAARVVLATELGASGSAAPKQMVVLPCSMGTLSAIAHGASDNLIERAADVVIKEKGQLILVPRETPYSSLHLENMLKLSRLGVTILPASPGFYHQPASVQDLVDFVVARLLDHLGLPQELMTPWGQ